MFKNITSTLLLLLAISSSAFSDATTKLIEINGTVKDSISGEGLAYASVQLIIAGQATPISGTLTDINGYYQLKKIPKGKYQLVASYMGYQQKSLEAELLAKQQIDFALSKRKFQLEEIEVVGEQELVEKSIEKTTINVAKDLTQSSGSALDVMQTLPSVDVDIDGKINYRGSDRVIILVNGEKSEMTKLLDQIPSDQIQKIELINNPSAKYDAEGMSGIVNIVLKTGNSQNRKTTFKVLAGAPETYGGHIGYSGGSSKFEYFLRGGANHKTKFQTKEHLRKNYENVDGYDYYQFDRQDEILNNAFVNAGYKLHINKKAHLGMSVLASKMFNSASRKIDYETLRKEGSTLFESTKLIDIARDNRTADVNAFYRYKFKKEKQLLAINMHYSMLDQLHTLENESYNEAILSTPDLQNTYLEQFNEIAEITLDYVHPISDSVVLESGYHHSQKDLNNEFSAKRFSVNNNSWVDETDLGNSFQYEQHINALYMNLSVSLMDFDLQAGIRSEHTLNAQNSINDNGYLDFFPSLSIGYQLKENLNLFASYNRRINRPSIKMLNPFTDEYADILNMHRGNPDLLPEYVNSVEVGNRFIHQKFSGFISVYYRSINQAISSIKAASNDSALLVTFMNLDRAQLLGSEISLSYKPFKWWSLNTNANLFKTQLVGENGVNSISTEKTAWNMNLTTSFKMPAKFSLQLSGHYRSKLPSVMGIYIHRYYADLAISRKVLNEKGQLIFKISDVFNTYKYGLDLDAVDALGYSYSQKNRRKNESQYFILSFIYNIDGKEKKQKKTNFYLEGFDK